MKREGFHVCFVVLCLSSLLTFLPLAMSGAEGSAQESIAPLPKKIVVSTLSPGTMMYAVTSGLAKVASDNSPTTMVVVPGSLVASVPNMDKTGQPMLVLADSNTFYQSYTGKVAPEPTIKGMPAKNFYPRACRNLRALMAGSNMTFGFLARNDSGLEKVEDLKGKRIAWGWAEAPFQLNNTLTSLYNAGLTIDDVKTVPVTTMVTSVQALTDGRLDATNVAVGMGAISEADAMVGVHFLDQSMNPEAIKQARRCRAGVKVLPVPPGPAGLKRKTFLMASPMVMAASTHLPADVAYALLRVWWDNYEKWQNIHPILKLWTRESFFIKEITVPYHEGAVKFYKEKGLWDAEMDQIQARLLAGE
jgi:TRAP transporter TAXI family solute receptor